MIGKASICRPSWGSYIHFRTELKVIAAADGSGRDAVNAKIQRAQMLLEKLNEELLFVSGDIRRNTMTRDFNDELVHLTRKEYWNKYDNYTDQIKNWLRDSEQEMEEKYYEHHGRVIKKHVLIREQDDIIRDLRRKMVHERSSLTGEKRLIKDLRIAEETKAKIIVANGLKNDCYNYEAEKKYINDRRAELVQRRALIKAKRAQVDVLEKEIKLWEKQLVKLNKMKEEVVNFISFQVIQQGKCASKQQVKCEDQMAIHITEKTEHVESSRC